MGSVERISEHFLLPVLEALLEAFPFGVRGFHADNGSVVRKHLGYAHIPGRFASEVNAFTQGILSPYLNFHRPCFFPTEETDTKGRIRKRYRYAQMMTPYDKLKSLQNAAQYLKPGISFELLDEIAYAISDNQAAQHLNQARAALFRSINNAQTPAA